MRKPPCDGVAPRRELNALKPTAVPWMYAVCTCAAQEALRTLDTACDHCFRRVELKKASKYQGQLGSPKRTRKKKGVGGFRFNEGPTIGVFANSVQLPRLGPLRLKERGSIPTSRVTMLSATVREHAGHGDVSVLVEHEHPSPVNTGPVVGVDLDLGLKRLATRSDPTGGSRRPPGS
jgi:transposase